MKSRVGVSLAVLSLLIALSAFILIIVVFTNPHVLISPEWLKEITDHDDDKTSNPPPVSSKEDSDEDKSDSGSPFPEQPPAGWHYHPDHTHDDEDSKVWPEPEGEPEPQVDKRVYMFGLGINNRPFEYLDDTGDVEGFNKDVVNEVCEVMNKKCDFYVYKNYKLCWDTNTWHAVGLMDNWFDACVGWISTIQRSRSYEIMGNFVQPSIGYFWVKDDSIITEINYNTHKFVFRAGWFTSNTCLLRLFGKSVKPGKMQNVESWEEGVELVTTGAVEIFFTTPGGETTGLKKLGDGVDCATGGQGLMVRKDRKDELLWFDDGVKKIMENGKYEWLCKVGKKLHEGDCRCLEVPQS